ncbi:hypothetical protein LINPERHAP2_LOCUS11742 [Linum perenne]
MLWFGDPEGDQ